MKNFETHCPINGTSALQPKLEPGNVIAFPGSSASSSAYRVMGTRNDSPDLPRMVRSRVLDSEMAQSLRYGSAQGRSFDRVKPWQAAFVGVVFTLFSFASVLLAL